MNGPMYVGWKKYEKPFLGKIPKFEKNHPKKNFFFNLTKSVFLGYERMVTFYRTVFTAVN
jgi:hypothetical protein